MLQTRGFFSERFGSFVLGLVVLITTLVAYRRTGELGLRVDELLTIVQMDTAISEGRSILSVVFSIQQGSHFLPLSMLVNYLRYHFFHVEPAGWFATALAGHLIVVILVQRLYLRLAYHAYWGWAAACLFGVAFIHWDSVMWSYNLGLFVSAALFVLTLLAFESYARTGLRLWGVTCVAFHWLGLLNSSGLEMPVLCLLLYWWMRRKDIARISWFQCFTVFGFMVIGIISLTILREMMISSTRDSASNLIHFGLDSILQLPFLVAGAFYAGIAKSFIGLGGTMVPALFFLPVAILIIFLLRPPKGVVKSNYELALMLFVMCGLLLVLAAIFRGAQPGVPFHWFINTSRYQYIPCIPAAIAAILLFKNFHIFSETLVWPKPLGIILLFSVVVLNILGLRERFFYLLDQSQAFERQTNEVLDELRHVVKNHSGPVGIVDSVFYDDTSVRIGWDVRISLITKSYAHDLKENEILFIRPGASEIITKGFPIYAFHEHSFVNINSE